jgi:hypothetical protein
VGACWKTPLFVNNSPDKAETGMWVRGGLMDLALPSLFCSNVVIQSWMEGSLTRFNSANVLDEGLRIGEIGRRMNSKVKLVETGVYRK